MVDDDELVLGSWGLTELPDVFACILDCTATGDDVTVRHPRAGGHLALHQESVFALYLIVESILQIDNYATDARGRAWAPPAAPTASTPLRLRRSPTPSRGLCAPTRSRADQAQRKYTPVIETATRYPFG